MPNTVSPPVAGPPAEPNPDPLAAYAAQHPDPARAICETLRREIDAALPGAESKIWHRAPVWFLSGNPVVGYWVRKDHVQLLFWSGQSFDEPGLKPEGSFKAAQRSLRSTEDIEVDTLKRWLDKAVTIQWDYKNIVKRKGKLERLS